ncbi:hypothetical protein ACT91Q_13220 [Brevibacillus thermoruber]|uniref:hypothetical protein n=1 Tax=Brevibacillus thermoruber TaxID=33942 RepID=UPI00404320D2
MSQICSQCGHPIPLHESSGPTCMQCKLDEYRIVRNYLRSHPNSNAMQIANATGISISNILRYIKSGSLTMVDNDRRRPGR